MRRWKERRRRLDSHIAPEKPTLNTKNDHRLVRMTARYARTFILGMKKIMEEEDVKNLGEHVRKEIKDAVFAI